MSDPVIAGVFQQQRKLLSRKAHRSRCIAVFEAPLSAIDTEPPLDPFPL